MKTIIIEDLRNINSNPDNAFRVKKLTNSIEFKIGEVVSIDAVNRLLRTGDQWTVNIVKKS